MLSLDFSAFSIAAEPESTISDYSREGSCTRINIQKQLLYCFCYLRMCRIWNIKG